jgi:hypothetical protein
MKRLLTILICGLLAFTACQKRGMQLFRGDYSFKTSGSITAKRANVFDPAEFHITLDNEIGQLQIASLDRKNDSLVVVMNYLNGEVVVTHAYCEGQNITFKDFKHNSLKVSIDGNIDVLCEVNVNAVGTMYDDNTMILNMTYDGEAGVGNLKYDLYGDDIKMVATRN